jgi:hypothetical protein
MIQQPFFLELYLIVDFILTLCVCDLGSGIPEPKHVVILCNMVFTPIVVC